MNNDQTLIDLIFSIGLTINQNKFESDEECAAWIARQLRICGIDTEPCGASWGVLKS